MRFSFISRRRHDDDLAAASAEAARLREQRDKAIKDMETAVFNRERILHQYTELDEKYVAVVLVNERLTEDLAAARADASASLAGQLRAELKREKRRADRLQRELDDATFLPVGGVEDSRRFQPGYTDPKQATA
ncbi:hypothetical protein PYK79_41355 [Streptomyces sp. ID05-04B]|uniref:hypothetical protein n=1 Tax=Streptomyces sp. ID05-04B TaxID=3028661 RepID=UPI0029C224D4|nr:hypothetical protein [Streptomyces sp. ID05-04B]MDX5568452.1 hypothetical protein [Streptomyces sp. ID05-04B]